MAVVSIIVPVYNAELYLAECLDSLIHQTLEDIEIVCIDDGSTDASREILREYSKADDRITVLSQKNRGVSASRNAGLEHSTGNYVMFVDADDYISHLTCELLTSVMEEKSADIAVFGGKTFPTLEWADNAFAHNSAVCLQDEAFSALFSQNGSIPLMCNKMYSRDLLNRSKVRLNEELSLGEDHAFQLLVFPYAKTVLFISSQLYFYRIRSGSAVDEFSQKTDERIEKHLALVVYVAKEWARRGFLDDHCCEFVEWFVRFLYEDFRNCSFEVRKKVSTELVDLTLNVIGDFDFSSLSESIRKRYNTMLSSAGAFRELPSVTFVVSSHFGECITKECLDSILSQTDQNIECLIDSGSVSADVLDCARRDKRCKVIEGIPLKDVVAECEGSYLLFSSGNARFQPTAAETIARQALDAERKGWSAPDVMVFDEVLHVVQRSDPLAVVVPSAELQECLPHRIAVSRFANCVYTSFGLVLCDKAFNAIALKAALARHDLDDNLYVVGLIGLYSAFEDVCFSDEQLVAFSPIAFGKLNDFDYLNVEQLKSVWRELKAFGSFFDDGAERQDYEKALTNACYTLMYSLESYEAFSAVFPHLDFNCILGERKGLDSCKRGIGDDRQTTNDGEIELLNCYSCMAEKRSRTYVELLMEKQAEIDNVANWALEADRRTRALAGEVREYETSTSYRLGRKITAPARWLRAWLGGR